MNAPHVEKAPEGGFRFSWERGDGAHFGARVRSAKTAQDAWEEVHNFFYGLGCESDFLTPSL